MTADAVITSAFNIFFLIAQNTEANAINKTGDWKKIPALGEAS